MVKNWLITVTVATALVSGAVQASEGHQAAAPQVGDPQAGEAKANGVCIACHGPQGNSIVPLWPKLAGQHPEYIVKQLMDFKAGRRANEQMTPMAMPLTDQEVLDLAAYYATQPKAPGAADPELASKGESIYRWGNPETGVPACSGCHGPAGQGQSLAKFPRISAQHADYTKQTLEHFRGALRANDPNGMMRGAAARLSDQEIAAVSQYIQGLSQ
ncbi:c-type cytochrome [Thiocapsa marina]|uniref:Cytochrome c class I n=1 Tax=Thiocapsa marina 5811 TaxID=768671 RepID=F9UCU8_9GAMM|nr:cytochrome c class I [Thiocapsa marina 5811]